MTNISNQVTSVGITSNIIVAAPLTLSQLALPQNFGALTSVKKAIVAVPVRKPSNQTFVRVMPEDSRSEFALIELKDEGETYLVLPQFCGELAQEVKFKRIYLAITRDGTPFLWPVSLPNEDGRLDAWSQSAHAAAELAETSWIRLVSNRSAGAYDVTVSEGLGIEPKWPDKTFEELLHIGFKGKIITSLDHPVIRRLRGEV